MKKASWWIKSLSILNVVGFIAVLIINYLANALPIGGLSTGALSDLYPNLFVLAGLIFAIWGLIYLMLGAFVVWQLVDVYKKQSKGIVQKIGIWFLLSCLVNIAWIFAWQYQQVALSVGIIILFLAVLIVISYKVNIGKKLGKRWEKICVQTPFSLYLGWLSVATIANITALLVHIWWTGRGITDIVWTNIVIVVAAFLALLALWRKADIIYSLVIIWAFLGIILKRLAVDPVYASSIIWVLWICISVISLWIGLRFEKWKKN